MPAQHFAFEWGLNPCRAVANNASPKSDEICRRGSHMTPGCHSGQKTWTHCFVQLTSSPRREAWSTWRRAFQGIWPVTAVSAVPTVLRAINMSKLTCLFIMDWNRFCVRVSKSWCPSLAPDCFSLKWRLCLLEMLSSKNALVQLLAKGKVLRVHRTDMARLFATRVCWIFALPQEGQSQFFCPTKLSLTTGSHHYLEHLLHCMSTLSAVMTTSTFNNIHQRLAAYRTALAARARVQLSCMDPASKSTSVCGNSWPRDLGDLKVQDEIVRNSQDTTNHQFIMAGNGWNMFLWHLCAKTG